MIEAALKYLRAGLCVLPAVRAEKRPAVPRWKEFQRALPGEEQLAAWCRRADALCLVCGAVSGNLEMLDFDLGGEAFNAWYAKVRESDATLPDRLVIEQSPSGGWHVVYRCQEPVCGNLKLAQRAQLVDGPDEVTIAGKTYKPRQDAQGRWHVVLTTIESRGEGGLFLCAPTPGYELVQGDLAELPVLSAAERETLLEAAWSLNQYWPPAALVRPSNGPVANPGIDGRPGDDFNQRGDVRTLLERHGWTQARSAGSDGNEHWRRPGKNSGTSATLKDGVFYVFSTNAAPFEAGNGYSRFAVYTLLEHGGDYAAAASALRAEGFGGDGVLPGGPLQAGIDGSASYNQPAGVCYNGAAFEKQPPVVSGSDASGEKAVTATAGTSGDSGGGGFWDWLQGGLDVAGLVPGFGEAADATNAVISAFRGDWTGAGLSAASMIPIYGDAVGKGGKLARYAVKHGDEAAAAVRGATKASDLRFATKYGQYARRADNFKHVLSREHVLAALAEKQGKTVKLKSDGTPYNHLAETRNAMVGAKRQILRLRRHLTDPNLTPEQRAIIEGELSELSKMLDQAEIILGELAQ